MKSEIPIHPAALPVPPMTTEEFEDLKSSMRKNGFLKQHPIVMLDGMILDGRHRYRAATELGIAPEFEEYYEDCPSEYVVAANTRRNLDASQRAVWAANMVPLIQADNERRRRIGQPVSPGRANEIAAAAVGISPAQVTKAIALKRKNPQEFKAVGEGKTSLNKAASAKNRLEEKAAQIERIGSVLGLTFSEAVLKGTILKTDKEIAEMASLGDGEMRRIQMLVQQGWTIAKARHYTMTELSFTHKIRDLMERAAALEGRYDLTLEGWVISVRRQEMAKGHCAFSPSVAC